jgi:aminoglycoside 2'-N-acetyltransferase I
MMADPEVRLRPVTNFVEGLSDEERRELSDLAMRCFGPPEARTPHPLVIAPDEDTRYVVRVWDDGLLVSCLWITERTITVDGQPARIAGIRGVRTDSERRRRGYATAAMRRAAEFIWSDIRPDLAMLLSSEMAVPFYQSLGWQIIEGPVYYDQPTGKQNLNEVLPERPTMVLLPEGRDLPRGAVDLCGLPF